MADFPGDRNEPGYVTRGRTARTLAAAGARALLIPSDKRDRLLDIGCFGNYPAAALPMLSIAREDAASASPTAWRKGRYGCRCDVDNALDHDPRQSSATWLRNGAARRWRSGSSWSARTSIPGTRPRAPTTMDRESRPWSRQREYFNRSASAAERTIRFVFFSGEEQAILGSHAYVDAHEAELDRVDAVLIMDEGAGVPAGFRLHGRTDLEASVRRILQPLQRARRSGLSQEASFDQDHAYFLAAGVPALTLWVEPGEYETHHHAITDTIDKIDRRTLAVDTAVMAVAAVALADADAIGARLSRTARPRRAPATDGSSTRALRRSPNDDQYSFVYDALA